MFGESVSSDKLFLQKTPSSRLDKPLDIDKDSIFPIEKAYLPTEVTLFGILIDVNLLQ